jgi:Tfp pilus assembly protein PilV
VQTSRVASSLNRRCVFAKRLNTPDTLDAPCIRRGLSLFEVVIALTIFVCSMGAIGQLISTGVRGAVQARLQSQAVLRAETQMAEVVAGLISLHGASGVFPDDPSWSWSVTTTSSPHANLYVVEVTTTHSARTTAGKQSFSLRRLVRDPQMALDAYAKAQEAEAAAAASGSTSSTNSSGTGSGASSSGGGK